MALILRPLAALFILFFAGVFPPPVFSEEEAPDPYGTVLLSRISHIDGDVLFQRGDDEEWVAASVNMPLRPHDRLWATNAARSEIQFEGGSAARIAENTNLDLLALEPGRIQLQITLGVASFTVSASSRAADESSVFEVDTPQASLQVPHSAKFRIDVAEDGSTVITVRDGEVDLTRDEEPIVIFTNQRVAIEAGDAPRYELESAPDPDEWDRWNEDRDTLLVRDDSREHLPSGAEEMGAADLYDYGRWDEVPAYGWVWVPPVSAGWAPYRVGRWVWVEPWGWTWVSYEPWGWMPYHYGRWVVVGSVGWVWVPGPRFGVWAPGCVRFFYGPDWVAWVPLGPGEIYYYRPPGPSVRIDIHLTNYDHPGGRTVMSRRRFVSGDKDNDKKFHPPKDPVRTGRPAAGPPPIVPVPASLHPVPGRIIPQRLLPPRATHRPVVFSHTPPAPPQLFEKRVREIHGVITKGLVPAEAAPRSPKVRPSVPAERRPQPERIQKDITVREPILRHRITPVPAPTPKETPAAPEKRIAPRSSTGLRQPPPPRSIRLPEPPASPAPPKTTEEGTRQVRPLYRVPPRYNPKQPPQPSPQQPDSQTPPAIVPGRPHR